VADGKGPDTRVRDVMNKGVKYFFEDETVEAVSRNMGDQQMRRPGWSAATSGWSASSRWATSPRRATAAAPARRSRASRGPAARTISSDGIRGHVPVTQWS